METTILIFLGLMQIISFFMVYILLNTIKSVVEDQNKQKPQIINHYMQAPLLPRANNNGGNIYARK